MLFSAFKRVPGLSTKTVKKECAAKIPQYYICGDSTPLEPPYRAAAFLENNAAT
jgi:hypothetical protein